VSEDMLHRSDSFNDNGFASGKLLWRSEKLLISDGAASSSGVVVICLPSLWRSLWWCRMRRIDAGFLHRFILSFQFCKVCSFVTCFYLMNKERFTVSKKNSICMHIHPCNQSIEIKARKSKGTICAYGKSSIVVS
jgi:hypothetical protein